MITLYNEGNQMHTTINSQKAETQRKRNQINSINLEMTVNTKDTFKLRDEQAVLQQQLNDNQIQLQKLTPNTPAYISLQQTINNEVIQMRRLNAQIDSNRQRLIYLKGQQQRIYHRLNELERVLNKTKASSSSYLVSLCGPK